MPYFSSLYYDEASATISENLESILDLLYGEVDRAVYEAIKENVENVKIILDIE